MYSAADQKRFLARSKVLLQQPATFSELEELRQLLVYHEWRYYVKYDAVLTDFEYDQLYQQLLDIEAKHPEAVTPDSPSQRVGADLTDDFPAVPHLTPMLSLANSYNAEDLAEFDQQVKRFLGIDAETDIPYTVEPKFDGSTIVLVYENDRLLRAATRGNGVKGEDITANARAIRSIPLTAAFSSHGMQQVELRGEVIIRKSVFEQKNQARAEAGLTLFANARNTAAGGLRMKKPSEVAQRGLEAFLYQMSFAEGPGGEDLLGYAKSQDATIELLGDLGFKIPTSERKYCKNIHEAADFCIAFEEGREAYPYEIDGMVVKVDELALQARAGHTSHHPRWAIAYKFKAKQARTKLVGVEYQIGKIGSVTPVAKVEPVALAGVTVSSISLHNEDFITDKDLRLGDTVLIERAGDVIPYIVKAEAELRDGTEVAIKFPTQCPSCATPLLRAEGEAAWRCPNYQCPEQVLQRIIWHVSKQAMDIDGMGKQIVERFFELGWIKSLADVYRLDYEAVSGLEGFGEKSAANLEKSINKAKQNPIHRLLHSLSIHHLGKKASKLLAAEIQHVFDLKNWQEDDFTHIKDIGPTVAENVMAWFQEPENVALLEEMESLGVNLRQTEADRPVAVNTDGPLAGKSILFTGTLTTMGRKEAQEKAVAAGARNVSAVSGKLDILVVGEKAGSKLKKAQALGTVQILTEAEFRELVG